MDLRLQQAAESGSIDALYARIDDIPHILENIDAVPFVNTPLHVAAASGNIPFTMEMLNLKPSFARKLNTSGYSPLHLAVEKDQREFIRWLLWHDPGLARVKGREGITPFHLIAVKGDANLVADCLMYCPECIQDVSVDGHNALHLAVMNDRFEVLQVLTGWIQRMSQKSALSIEIIVLNRKDYSYNTALHLAAYKNDHQAVKLLLECWLVKQNEVNGAGLTFLDILRNHGQSTAGGDLSSNLDLEQLVLKIGSKEAALVPKFKRESELLKSPITFWPHSFTIIRRIRSSISDETRGVFLVMCTLLITATYQTALQPPGGVHQSGDANAGTVVMRETVFFLLWLSNTVGFCCALCCTFCLTPIGRMFEIAFFGIATSLCISYAVAMAVISPHPLWYLAATFTQFLLFPVSLLLGAFPQRWKKLSMVASKARLSWFW